ncbi:CDP-alcohol phosphatidyltransferase family protein [Natronosporangium hydrolyticum]|uniref:CDP-alcohol phosphatidyltransferase family protein n=1 Tax=Natronosporangium hydrolyticum TaxID=2811111 RepID=A0A895YJU0_9ACTN|nr:CDP-alcohol phosphatidyltransferase family protein [Natronosporangium hydrolyticum]QSB16275.1 CDP-alcohol phosphatidyltransferase family protein [Natronosporangium hydrolyticum]
MGWHQYAVAWAAQHGGYDLRRAPPSVRAWLRAGYSVARILQPLRIGPGLMFGLGGVLAVAVAVAAAGSGAGGLLLAAVLVPLSAFVGTLDGALTVLHQGDTARAAIRSVLMNRLGEVGWLTGFWLVGVPVTLVVITGAVTFLYEAGAREAIAGGMTRVGVHTVADRPMRVWVTTLGLLFAAFFAAVGVPLAAGLLAVATVVWLALVLVGAGQLTTAVRRSLADQR